MEAIPPISVGRLDAPAVPASLRPPSAAPGRIEARVPSDRGRQVPAGCLDCGVRRTCMYSRVPDIQRSRFETAIEGTRRIKAGQTLYRAGDACTELYAVRAGSFKAVTVLADDPRDRQITDFRLAGDFLGMEALGTGRHVSDAVALEDGMLCVLPAARLEALAEDIKEVRRYQQVMLGEQIARNVRMMTLIGKRGAQARVAFFLLNMAERFSAHGYSACEFTLRMSREEIGCYLGMKLETVSRMFSRLQEQGLIQMRAKRVRILDMDGLRQA
jgi:CRP/FNR family transcriptional regulator